MNLRSSISDNRRHMGPPTKRLLRFLTTLICLFCILSCQRYGATLPINPDESIAKSLPTHSLEERIEALVDLLTQADHEATLTKRNVESRMGKPDSVHVTGSKEFEDKVILTHYCYHLAPGDYILLKSQSVCLGSGAQVSITFNERLTYGSRGRPYSIRDDTAPLVLIQLEDVPDERYPHIFRTVWSWKSQRD